jgi:hypothetical protein
MLDTAPGAASTADPRLGEHELDRMVLEVSTAGRGVARRATRKRDTTDDGGPADEQPGENRKGREVRSRVGLIGPVCRSLGSHAGSCGRSGTWRRPGPMSAATAVRVRLGAGAAK